MILHQETEETSLTYLWITNELSWRYMRFYSHTEQHQTKVQEFQQLWLKRVEMASMVNKQSEPWLAMEAEELRCHSRRLTCQSTLVTSPRLTRRFFLKSNQTCLTTIQKWWTPEVSIPNTCLRSATKKLSKVQKLVSAAKAETSKQAIQTREETSRNSKNQFKQVTSEFTSMKIQISCWRLKNTDY